MSTSRDISQPETKLLVPYILTSGNVCCRTRLTTVLSVVTANLSLCAPGTHSITNKLDALTNLDNTIFYGTSEVLFQINMFLYVPVSRTV